MPNGGKGAVAKVYIEAEVIDNFKQQAAKIKTGLGNGLKDLKDLDLNFGFDTEAMAKAAGKELNTIMDLATNKKLNKLDFSGIMPGMISFLNNNEIADELKLQVVQGLRQGLEEFNRTATSIDINNLARRGDGADVWSNLLFSNATKDIVNSLGLKKGDSNIFLKQFGSLTSSSISGDKGSFIQDLSQLLSLKATAEKEEYQDVLKYLVSGKYVDGRGNEQQMFEMSMINDAIRINDFYKKSAEGNLTNKDIKDFAGYVGRLQYLTTVSDDKGLQEIYDSIIGNKHYNELFNNQDLRDEGLSKEQLDLFHSVMDKVIEASKYKDDQYRAIDKQAFNTDILQAINALFSAAGDNGTIARLSPLIQGWERNRPQLSADQLLADTIKSLGLKSEDKGLRQQEGSDAAERAEATAERAEDAAERAESASEEARTIAEDMKGTVEEGAAEASGTSKTDKKSKKKPSTQTSAEPVEQIVDDAEADAESAEHVVDALEDKKARLESTIVELENKNRELQELNNKYQKAISDTFEDVKTPEEALALFKEKASQLQQADKDFADIIPQRNFTDPSNSEEIAILEEYEKRLATLQQALIEYQKAGETAIDKGVNPADIRANRVDEERLQLNFSDNTIDGYIKGLQKAIEDNKKKISEYENLLKTYRGQLEELTRQGSPSDTKLSGGGQTQSRPATETAREETGEVQKTREELQAERKKLEVEIQNSTQLMNSAEGQITDIDTKIVQVQEKHQHNETNISQLTEKKEQIESQIQQTKDELKTIKEKLQDAVDAKQAAEEEIRALEEKLLNADGSDIISADSTENLDKYNQLKEEKYSANFDLDISRRVLERQEQKQKEIEEILNGEYSTKTLQEAYKQAMARKKQYLQQQEEYDKMPAATDMFSIDEIGSADFMLAVAKQRDASMEVEKAWMAYYKAFQEFESHGRGNSGNKQAMRDRLLSGIDGHNLPTDTSYAAETTPDTLKEELISLNEQIEYDKKEVEEAQKKVDELQQQLDELASHLVTTDNISKQLEQKRQEQQKFEQEETNWTVQQDTKQAELDYLNERLNGTRGVANYLKAVQDGQQNNQEELAQLQQQRAEQQRIYDEAKAIQEEKARQLEELDKLIAETEAREPTVPTTAQEKPTTSSKPSEFSESPLSSSGGQTADGVQQEGNEADDAAFKMKALADAKKEALEANRQLAESADTTTNAIRNESDAENFDELISKLIEAAKLLGQLPQSFEGFKGFDLEPLNNLSQAIQQFPKEGFNITLGDSFNNLANNIDQVLQKFQELTTQAKTAEIESTFAEKYDEQIKELKADVEEAKRVIEELKKTKQDVQKTTSVVQSKKQETPVSIPVEPYFEDKIIGTNYGFLKEAQQKLFDTKTVQDFQAALQDVESILQRIQALENEAVQKHATPQDILYMAHNNSMSPDFESRMGESVKGRLESSDNIKSLTEGFVAQQQELVNKLQNNLKSIEIVPESARANWGDQQRAQYDKMVEGVKFAEAAVKELSSVLNELQTKSFNPEQMQWFLELKEATTNSINDLKKQDDTIQNLKSQKETSYLTKLDKAEKTLQTIKTNSKNLINIDPSLNDVLQQIEQHLKQIKQFKDAISKNPFEVLNPQFANSTESYISQLYGTDDSQGIVEKFKQTSDRSQADFSRMTTNYGKYASALKKLFDDMSKGAGVSLANLEEDLIRVNELATRLTGSTGLERDNLLTGELNPKAAPKVVDAQAEAASKVGIAYETMLTKIESKAESAKLKIDNIFGTEGVAQGLESGFVEGNVDGFDEFVNTANKAEESLKHLQEIQQAIKDDKTWLTQKENVTNYQQTMETLERSLDKVIEKAGDFKIVDDLDIQKLRASTAQFIRDNPALSAEDINKLEGYIDQLQGKINSVDFDTIKAGIEGVKQTAIEAGRTGDTFFSMLIQRFKSLGAYLLSFVSFYRVIGVFKDGINIIHELDDALTEMQKVSDESLNSLREYQKSTFDTANQIGTTAAQLQQSTADWMRLGENLQTASQSAQTANVLFNVSEFDNINEATTALVAMSAAYADAEKGIDKMDIVDRLNLIGNNYAIATDELATALQDGAAALQTAGNDLDEAIALTTAGNEKIA